MNERRVVGLDVGDDHLRYEVVGALVPSDDARPLDADDDLTAAAPWAADGYAVARFVDETSYAHLKTAIRDRIAQLVGGVDPEEPLERYHRWVTDEDHHRTVCAQIARGFPMEELPIDVRCIEERVSAICRTRVSAKHPAIEASIWALRLVRPNRANDHNPPHRDQWLDWLRHGVNLYAPLAGSTSRSSLPLAPGTHLDPESAYERTEPGAEVGGVRYSVPALAGARGEIRMIRPNPPLGSCLVFSPYLLHGGAANLEADVTRVSLEMRFWRSTD